MTGLVHIRPLNSRQNVNSECRNQYNFSHKVTDVYKSRDKCILVVFQVISPSGGRMAYLVKMGKKFGINEYLVIWR